MRSLAALMIAALGAACASGEPSVSPSPTLSSATPATAGTSSPPAGLASAPAVSPASPSRPASPTGLPAPDDTPEPAPADPSLAPPMQEVLDTWRDRVGVPAAALGLRVADGRTAVVVSGIADEATGMRVEPGDRFRIGSISKTFVAVLILQLTEDGRLRLDDRLSKYLPGAPHARQLTVRQLLNHTSGVPDFGVRPAYRTALLMTPGRRWDAADVIELIEDEPLDFEPGSAVAYSNTNYTLLGMLAEELGGEPLADLLRRRVRQPLGLDSTFLEEMEEGPSMGVAGHYDLNGDGRPENVRSIPYTALVTSGAAAGGISSNALDLLDFASGLFGRQLVGAATLDDMLTITAPSVTNGLGIDRMSSGGRSGWGHGGALPGFTALFVRGDDGPIIVALTNQTGVDLRGLVDETAARLLDAP